MALVSTFTFTSDIETVTRTKLNNIVANLLTEFNGNISNANIKASAAIVASKLDLTSPGAIGSTAPAAGAFTTLSASSATTLAAALIGTPDAITATSDGEAASVATVNTEVTTNDDNDLDNVTLANGTSGQIKCIYCVVSHAGDTWKITPATMLGGTQITFGDNSVGSGCILIYADNEGWIVVGNNGGTIS